MSTCQNVLSCCFVFSTVRPKLLGVSPVLKTHLNFRDSQWKLTIILIFRLKPERLHFYSFLPHVLPAVFIQPDAISVYVRDV